MVIKKISVPLLCITTLIHAYAMQQNNPVLRVTQISEFIDCVKLIQKQYPTSSPEYKKAIINLLETKIYKIYITNHPSTGSGVNARLPAEASAKAGSNHTNEKKS